MNLTENMIDTAPYNDEKVMDYGTTVSENTNSSSVTTLAPKTSKRELYINILCLLLSLYIMGSCLSSAGWSTITLIIAATAKKQIQKVDIAYAVINYSNSIVVLGVGVSGVACGVVSKFNQRMVLSTIHISLLVLYFLLYMGSTIASIVLSIFNLVTHTSRSRGWDIFICIGYPLMMCFTGFIVTSAIILATIRVQIWVSANRSQ
jgi:hypothetical protein